MDELQDNTTSATIWEDYSIINDMFTSLEYGRRIKLDYGMGTTVIHPTKEQEWWNHE